MDTKKISDLEKEAKQLETQGKYSEAAKIQMEIIRMVNEHVS
ncbi:MAG: hypothetical protein Q8935_10115 [Bacillota bacterium]|nr:hypothetical protein [Bacillota bacterium]